MHLPQRALVSVQGMKLLKLPGTWEVPAAVLVVSGSGMTGF